MFAGQSGQFGEHQLAFDLLPVTCQSARYQTNGLFSNLCQMGFKLKFPATPNIHGSRNADIPYNSNEVTVTTKSAVIKLVSEMERQLLANLWSTNLLVRLTSSRYR